MTPLVVDLFAGGGGASTGIEAALGQPVDIAINHDAIAMAVHRANHPGTRHLEADIWEVRPIEATGGRRVGLLWASPDCTHFSVAKGDVPKRQDIRSLAWAVVRWAKAVRPAVIMLENVSEFRGWGPLGKDGKPLKSRMGETFNRWKAQLVNLGYVVDYRVLDASHYGAPTRRRRLFLVARCDGQAIRWPEPTHGPGRLPYRTAAECIDWSIPCPSIFERKRPLAEKTLWRIAQGIKRFVLENPRPFIVKVNHGEDNKTGTRVHSLDEPLTTVTASGRGHAVVSPVFATIDQRGSGDRTTTPADSPLPTTVVKNRHVVITPILVEPGQRHGRGQKPGDMPLTTIVAKDRHAIAAATMVQTGYGEREGQAPRALDIEKPLGTIIAGGTGGNGKHALVQAFLAKHFGGVVGHKLDRPIGTVTAKDHHSLAAVALAKFRGDEAGGHSGAASIEEPLPTVTAGGNHVAEVRAFLTAYYGTDGTSGQSVLEPMRTLTAKHRLGLVTVEGIDYQIVDIGMRMLEPHELLTAQFGKFAASYDMTAAKTKAGKVRLIGNSVCPEVAQALVAENLPLGGVVERVA